MHLPSLPPDESVFWLVVIDLLRCWTHYEKHYSMYLLHFVIRVLLFLFCFVFLFLFITRVLEKAVNFIFQTLYCRPVVNISPAQKRRKPNDMFCSFTTNKKSSSLLFLVIFFNQVVPETSIYTT